MGIPFLIGVVTVSSMPRPLLLGVFVSAALMIGSISEARAVSQNRAAPRQPRAVAGAKQSNIEGFVARSYKSARETMPYRLFVPSGYDPHQHYPLILWLHGSGEGRAPSRLEHALRTFPEPDGPGYRWMAGETRVVRGARRHLRHERELPREEWSLTGYWLEGFEEWEARYREVETQMTEIWTRGVAEGRDEEDIMDDYERALEDAGL